jgi:hypothetical protein
MKKLAIILFGIVFGLLIHAVLYGAVFAAWFYTYKACNPEKPFPTEWALALMLVSSSVHDSIRISRKTYDEHYGSSTDH